MALSVCCDLVCVYVLFLVKTLKNREKKWGRNWTQSDRDVSGCTNTKMPCESNHLQELGSIGAVDVSVVGSQVDRHVLLNAKAAGSGVNRDHVLAATNGDDGTHACGENNVM